MRVSVIMPVYNKKPYLKEAMDSVLNSSFQDLELIAVDDGSKDGSAEMLNAITDPRVKVSHRATNGGPAAAAQDAIDRASGEYLVRLDADDIAVPDRVAKQVAFMDANPDIGASGGHLQLFGDRDQLWKFPLTNEECQAKLLFSVPVSQGASIIRTTVLKENDIKYDPAWPRVCEDWLLWIRLSRVTKFANLDEPMTLYRRGDQNVSAGRNRAQDYANLFKQAFQFFNIPFDQERLNMHMISIKHFEQPPTRDQIRGFRQWLDQLLSINAERSLFPEPNFSEQVERTWSELYHYLPSKSVAAALEHMRISGDGDREKIMFLAKTRINLMLGRS